MIHHIRVPAEQFAYLETDFEGSPEEAVQLYRQITYLVTQAKGIDPKEFNAVLDEYLVNDSISGDPGITEAMSVEQLAIIQAIKRSRARTNKLI